MSLPKINKTNAPTFQTIIYSGTMKYKLIASIVKLFVFCVFFLAFGEIKAQVSGTVFKDFNANGTKENTASYNEVGLSGVVVKATNPAGAALPVTYTGGGTATNATGKYAVTGGTLGQIRLEFVMPDNFMFASLGATGGTTIMFPSAATQDLAVNYPQDYVSTNNPPVTVPCYVNGDNTVSGSSAATSDAIVLFNYNTTGKKVIASTGQVGAVWGTAYHRQSDKLFYAALGKRHSNWGPLGSSGIYVTSSAKTATTTANTGNFVNLKAINSAFDAGSPVRNFAPGGGDKTQGNYDQNMILGAGTTGLGDLEVSDDGQYLYTVNLNDRKVWRIEVGETGTAPTSASQIVAYAALPTPCTNSTFRPFALKIYKGDIYVGGVCDGVTDLTSATSAVNRANLKATIYKTSVSATPSSATWTQVFEMPLTFKRAANLNLAGGATATTPYKDPNGTVNTLTIDSWHPWARTFADLQLNYTVFYPQPMLTDIEFDVDGSMILGYSDREGHQTGNNNLGLPPDASTVYYGTANGDIIRVDNSTGTFTLENNGKAGSITTAGAGNGQGPGGGEFYFQDRFDLFQSATPLYVNCTDCNHDETSNGGLALLPGSGEVLNTVFDARDSWDSGGVRWYSNTDGTAQAGILLYAATDVSLFGKATGIGDAEILLAPAPIEIGNRVWDDTDNDGVQDAGEAPISGVTVTLYAANGTTVVSTATTDANGNYYFSSGTGTNTASAKYGLNLAFNTNYVLGFPTTVSSKNITSLNSGANDLVDSDANVSTGKISFTTGSSGENNHSFDVGYALTACTNPTATASATQPTCTGTNAPDNGKITIAGFTSGQRYQYTSGTSFTGTATPTTITAIPAGGVITSTLANTSGSYTVRIYDATDNTCFVDRTVTITAVVCCTVPVVGTPVVTKATCNAAGTAANNDAKISISGISNATVYAYTTDGTTPAFAGATAVSGGAINLTGLANPAAATTYKFRIFNGSATCYTDVTATLSPKVCNPSCTPPDAGADIAMCLPKTTADLTDAAAGTQWVAVAGNPSAATINATTGVITGMTAIGTYLFRLQTTADATCYGEMQIVVSAGDAAIALCNDGSTSYKLTAPANLTNVIWYNMAGQQVGTGNTLNVTSATNGLADGSEAFYYEGKDGTTATGCDVTLCCPVKFITQACCPTPNCGTVSVIKN